MIGVAEIMNMHIWLRNGFPFFLALGLWLRPGCRPSIAVLNELALAAAYLAVSIVLMRACAIVRRWCATRAIRWFPVLPWSPSMQNSTKAVRARNGSGNCGFPSGFHDRRPRSYRREQLSGPLSTAWNADGLLCSIDAEDDADHFLHLLRAGLYEKRLLGIASRPTADQIASRVSRAVQVFLRGLEPQMGRRG
jgi:hypothetical protein